MTKMAFSPKFFFFLSFIEGGVVMAIELIGAKMLAPYFGTSLYVWTTVMAITLGGLASGYFIGGWLSHKKKDVKTLLTVALIGAMCVVVMPFSATFLTSYLIYFNFFFALITSTIIFLLPPVFMMGMVSPIIVSHLTTEEGKAGMMSGTVYAISTVGGIISTFLTGFWIIPKFGLTIPCIIFGIIFGIVPFIMLIFKKNKLSVLFPVLCFFVLKQATAVNPKSSIKILYDQEGLLGQMMVADVPSKVDSLKKVSYDRYLFVNRIAQSMICLNSPDSITLPYMNVILKIISTQQLNGKRALVLGLGGGILSNHLFKLGLNVEACELDKRMYEASKKYFGLPAKIKVTIDDARHFLETNEQKYDFIFFDVFRGEENPEQVFTKECFSRTLELLNEHGILIINGNGYWDGEIGLGMRSVAKTLLNSKINVSIYTFNNRPDERNLLFVANRDPQTFNDTSLIRINFNEQTFTNASILEDDRPLLSVLNKDANLAWRKGYVYSTQVFTKANIPVFR